MKTGKISIFWFRRDLRLHDNAGLFHALKSGTPVLPVFIFDTHILDKLNHKSDRRVTFIHNALESIQQQLVSLGSSLSVFYGTPEHVLKHLISAYQIDTVYCNHDYEPYAIERDKKISLMLAEKNIRINTFKDHVIFEKNEVMKDDGNPYTVFTPYSRKWKSNPALAGIKQFSSEEHTGNFLKRDMENIPTLEQIGFKKSSLEFPGKEINEEMLIHYTQKRDFPGENGTSKLGVHLRFGTVSIRQLVLRSRGLSETYLNELIWRDFYHMILWHFPKVGKGYSFKPAYDNIAWEKDQGEFDKWCKGQTGYPIVDAGMRELNETGFMHNRVRMITASFLCKHLLLDWRLGEAYFADKLLDFDFAANNGGWQWAAGSGCDAAPYFRIFNPALQTKKFDPNFTYIRKWVPEYRELTYPGPVVDHEFARKRCLAVYARALKPEQAFKQ